MKRGRRVRKENDRSCVLKVSTRAAAALLTGDLLGHVDPSFGYEGWAAMTTPDVFEVWRDAVGLHFKRLWQEA